MPRLCKCRKVDHIKKVMCDNANVWLSVDEWLNEVNRTANEWEKIRNKAQFSALMRRLRKECVIERNMTQKKSEGCKTSVVYYRLVREVKK